MQLQSDSCLMEPMAMNLYMCIATVGNTIQTVNSPMYDTQSCRAELKSCNACKFSVSWRWKLRHCSNLYMLNLYQKISSTQPHLFHFFCFTISRISSVFNVSSAKESLILLIYKLKFNSFFYQWLEVSCWSKLLKFNKTSMRKMTLLIVIITSITSI